MIERKEPRLFEEGHPVSDYLLEWWNGLKQNKGDRAELRRSKNLQDIQTTSAFPRCYWGATRHFDQEKWKPSKEQLAIITGLLAYVEENDTAKKDEQGEEQNQDYFGYQISRGDKEKLSELRFRRLLKIKNREKLFRFLIQTIRLLDKKVNLLDLLRIAYFWGDSTRIKLSYQYYEMRVFYEKRSQNKGGS
jgi:CRISPR system Cascade subunit CasB